VSLTLNMIETGLRAGLDEARAMVGSPAAALAVAERLLREDPAAVADFNGDAGNLAGWLLNESRRGRLQPGGGMAGVVGPQRVVAHRVRWRPRSVARLLHERTAVRPDRARDG
jgi:hypothetical protein